MEEVTARIREWYFWVSDGYAKIPGLVVEAVDEILGKTLAASGL